MAGTYMGNFPLECIAAINDVLRVGAEKGYPSASWRAESCGHHVWKIIRHLAKMGLEYLGLRRNDEDHLKHILCRAAMAVAVRQTAERSDRWQ